MIFSNLLFSLVIGSAIIQTNFEEQPVQVETVTASSSSKCSFNNGKISIKFPGDFEISTVEKETATTKKAVHTSADGIVYYMAWTLHESDLDDPATLCDVSVDSFVESSGSELQSKSTIKYKKHKGQQAIMKFNEGQINYRVFIIGQNQIQIVVASGTKDIGDEASKFFKSFKYKG